MPKEENFSDLQRDLGRRKPNMSRGTPWIGSEVEQDGESTGAFPGTGSTLPQDIGADGFQIEEPLDEVRDDLSMIDNQDRDVAPDDEFDTSSLDMTPSFDGHESELMSTRPDKPSRVDAIDEDETFIDKEYAGGMGESAELSELPIGSENATAGEMGRYECPNCGFEYDVVVGARARCPACNREADLSNIIGDESFHHSFAATDLDDQPLLGENPMETR